MKVLIDTNVILDVLTKREPHYALSASFLRLCGFKVIGCMTASQTTDIFYMLLKNGVNTQAAKGIIQKLSDNITVADTNNDDVQNALASDMPDYEDALLAFCAKRQKVEYIVTRNERDFRLSPVPPLTPRQFFERFFPA